MIRRRHNQPIVLGPNTLVGEETPQTFPLVQ